MNELHVEVFGGLCNRVRVFISASYLAERTGRKLVLHWLANDDCGASFGNLFTNSIAETDSFPTDPPPWTANQREALVRALQSSEAVAHVSACEWLVPGADFPKTIPYFAALRPVDAVVQGVNAADKRFHGNTMGVHVRRGDFEEYLPRQYNLRLPPLARYFAFLDDWQGTIFLATDGGEAVEGKFRERYGDRVVTHPKRCPGRNTPEAVQDALVDVYLLSRCQALIGTRFSSFSGLAWTISRVPHARVTDRRASLFTRLKFSSQIALSRFRRQDAPRRWSPRSLSP